MLLTRALRQAHETRARPSTWTQWGRSTTALNPMVSAETRLASQQVKQQLLEQLKQPLYGYMGGWKQKKR
eukprot:1997792-Karenia_brevis.AAC.1